GLPGKSLVAPVRHAGVLRDVAAARDAQVVLRDLELVEESILHDVHFVEVVAAPQMHTMISREAELHHHVFAEFALPADVPALHVTQLEVRLKIADAGTETCRIRKNRCAGQTRPCGEGRLTEQAAADRSEIVGGCGEAYGRGLCTAFIRSPNTDEE